MTVAAANGAMARAREVLNRALAAPNGLRMDFLDATYPAGAREARRDVSRWQMRFYQARTAMRRVQVRMAAPDDILRGLTSNAVDPDAVVTAYYKLYFTVERNGDDTGWILYIRNAEREADGLNITEL